MNNEDGKRSENVRVLRNDSGKNKSFGFSFQGLPASRRDKYLRAGALESLQTAN
jgi:hypothetical protein